MPAGKRRAAPVRRRPRLLPILGGAIALALTGGVIADLSAGGGVGDLLPTASSTSHQATPSPKQQIVAGVHLTRHVPTLAELDATYAAQGLERVGAKAHQETTFKVSSFNVLGAIHTSTKRSAHPRWPSGGSRMGRAVGMLRANDISVVGLQEFEVPQYRTFLGVTGGAWGVYPGDSLGSQPTDNSIAWRKADWTLVEADTTPIPYYGPDIPMPHVLLRNVHTGQRVWFANYHNPSDDHGPAQGKRDAAVRIEAALVKELSKDGTPVIQTGDYNDRQEAACPMMSLADMHASNGSTYGARGCSVPMRPYPTVDWIFGTSTVTFSGHIADWSTRDREISDHEMIRASASVAARADDPACVSRTVEGVKRWWCPKQATPAKD
jgi:hypothetical protein